MCLAPHIESLTIPVNVLGRGEPASDFPLAGICTCAAISMAEVVSNTTMFTIVFINRYPFLV
jgi:hypothetical protein